MASENTQGKKYLSKSLMPNYDNYGLEDIYDKNYYNKGINDSNNNQSSKYSYNIYYGKDSKDKKDYYNDNTINTNNSHSETSLINREVNSIINSTIGLNNLGNTCFMNTCLQNLIHSEYFIKLLFSKKHLISKKTPITYQFIKLCLETIDNDNINSITPNYFKDIFSSKNRWIWKST